MRTNELSPSELRLLDQTVEEYARLGLGQLGDALERLPTGGQLPCGWHDDMLAIRQIVSRHTLHHVDGWNSSLSIAGAAVPADTKIAWDLHKVLAHRLAWDRAVIAGHVTSLSSPRDYATMQGVHYDTPSQRGSEPLVTVDVVGQGADLRYHLTISKDQAWTIVTALEVRVRTEAGDPRLALQALPLRGDLDAAQWQADRETICATLARHVRPAAGGATTDRHTVGLLLKFQDLLGCARRLTAADAALARRALGEGGPEAEPSNVADVLFSESSRERA